jgi:N-acetylglucosaminyldiphosphoundecaprenol N-acetyl-beta-D-mannosaminyltransferase
MKSVLTKKILDTEAVPFDSVLRERGRVYTFLNPVSYLDALERKDLFAQFDGIFADGSILVAAIRMVYGVKVTRRSCDMTSIGKQLLEISSQTGKSLYYVASKQEEIETAMKMFKEKFPDANIIGYRNGYFANEDEMDEEARHIAVLSPDYLVVGMGAIKQEEFLIRTKRAGYQGIGFTCGGFIHQTAHNEMDYYPAWIDRLNLRFLYRMCKEPHTRKRYLIAGLVFPARFIWERFFG